MSELTEIIRSAENATVKRINKLKQKKYRDETGEFIVEGYRNVKDTAEYAPESVRLIVFGETAYRSHCAEFGSFRCVVMTDELISRISDAESSQGIVSINAKKPSEKPQSGRCIYLDRVRDPGNVGTILRTAIAAGFDVIVNDCADIYSPKVVRSAMSAVLKCRIGVNLDISELKGLGYEIIVADMHGENVFTSKKPQGKYCIVIGNEADGVSRDSFAQADKTLCIPQNGIESLNAAIAAGVMMFVLSCGNN